MLKKFISVITLVCLIAALPCIGFAVDEGLEVEKARKAIDSATKTVELFNDITMDEFFSTIKKVLPEGSEVKLSFDKESDFRVYNATSEKDGSVFANINLTLNRYSKHEMYSFKIPKLTGDVAANNAKFAEDKAAVAAVFKGVSFDSDITAEAILEKVKAVIKNGTQVKWADGFVKVDSTDTKKGSVKGVLELSLNGDKATIKVYNGLRLANAESKTETSTPDTSNTPQSFTDVKADAYYAAAVAWAVDKKITAGTSNTTFSPDMTCTRAQIITFLWRAVGSPKTEDANPFSDVKTTDYYYDAAKWAGKMGMVTGSTFAADTPCTRALTVTYLWINAGKPSADTDTAFTDVAENADYAEAVAWAVENSVTSGMSETQFAPDTICSRGQIVTFLNRAIK